MRTLTARAMTRPVADSPSRLCRAIRAERRARPHRMIAIRRASGVPAEPLLQLEPDKCRLGSVGSPFEDALRAVTLPGPSSLAAAGVDNLLFTETFPTAAGSRSWTAAPVRETVSLRRDRHHGAGQPARRQGARGGAGGCRTSPTRLGGRGRCVRRYWTVFDEDYVLGMLAEHVSVSRAAFKLVDLCRSGNALRCSRKSSASEERSRRPAAPGGHHREGSGWLLGQP